MESTRDVAGIMPGDGDVTRERAAPLRVLFVSNGHGEDTIAVALAREIARRSPFKLSIEAWPMVGDGSAYRALGITPTGPFNRLPSEGFGTLSASAFLRDLRAGWMSVHWRQWRASRALRDVYDGVVAIGDIVPLLVAAASALPFVFVGCAKSAYYGGRSGYTWFERRLMRGARAVYPRDERTSVALTNAGLPVRALGNPMMDGVQSNSSAPQIDWRDNEVVAACLPGSRSDREHNAALILSLVARESARYAQAGIEHFAFALPRDFDIARLRSLREFSSGGWIWESDVATDIVTLRCGSLRATMAFGAFGEILAKSRVAIGLAGTANEQAVGSGVPVVTFATDGVQGESYLRMKMPYFGASVLRVPRDATSLCDALLRIVGDDSLRSRMIAAGKERMGAPGATAAIADDIIARLLSGISRA